MVAPATGIITVAQGTTIKKGAVKIATLTAIDGLDVQLETIETTVIDSPQNWKTYTAGMKDAGEISIKGRFNYTDHNVLFTDLNAGTANQYTIEFPDKGTTSGTQWVITAIVTGFKTTADMGAIIEFEAKLKISGPPTLNTPA